MGEPFLVAWEASASLRPYPSVASSRGMGAVGHLEGRLDGFHSAVVLVQSQNAASATFEA